MAEGIAVSNDTDAAAQRASEQARLRKERREAKLKAGGSARLNKINGLAGRPQADFSRPEPTESSSPTPAPTQKTSRPPIATATATTAAEDPEEVDISEHFYAPKTTQRNISVTSPLNPEQGISDDALRQMMLGFDPAQTQNPFAPGMDAPGADDPIMKMMSQMMGGQGMPGLGGDASSPFPGFLGAQQQAAKPVDPYTALWRLLHALVALGLGLYIAILTPFTGTKLEREHAAVSDAENRHRKELFFWVFATAEVGLLTTRFFLDKGRAPPSGIIHTVIGYLPEPFKGHVQVFMRYGKIFSTVRSDILACIFVLGVCSWWRGVV